MGTSQKNNLSLRAISLAKVFHYEERHALHVAKLAKSFFDQLSPLHKLGEKERTLLEAAAILHDIGWVKGQQKHHKTSQALIIQSQQLGIPRQQRIRIGLIARYHRKSLPEASHKYFCDLDEKSKRIVKILASFLRLADGLDRTHQSSVEDVICKTSSKQILVQLKGKRLVPEDITIGRRKADLLKDAFKKIVRITFTTGCPPKPPQRLK
ncbi:MAG: HD domain-containing protein [Candidatus Omnitrophica bacterium]|nr:HD domain-containing protein [Candidatus Omnitrophota bacterium]